MWQHLTSNPAVQNHKQHMGWHGMEEGMLCYASSLLHPTEEESNNTELPLQSLKTDGQQLSRRDF